MNTAARKPRATSAQADSDFDRFWAVYPKKVAVGGARKAWIAARKKATADVIVTGAESYRDGVSNTERKFICTPAKWLNDERWSDESASTRTRQVGSATGGAFWDN